MQAQQTQAQQSQTYPHRQATPRSSRLLNKLVWTAILLGVPIAALWVINLPYAPVRRPIARAAPMLLLPSYMSMDNHYRQAIALVEQSKQLIDRPTSPADLDIGAQKVQQAQADLDALPIDLLEYRLDGSYGWYNGLLTTSTLNAARAQVAQLQAKAFQEKNAQDVLFQAEQALTTAKQQYQQATTSTDKQAAIETWRSALDRLQQIPGQTLAGRTAQQKFAAEQRNFKDVVGLAADNEQTATLIEAARQFGAKAAQSSQNPPHKVAEWQQIESLWQEAIDRLERVSAKDSGYAETQELLATYQGNLGAIRIRRQAEADSVLALQDAQRQIQSLLASTNRTVDPNTTMSQLQGIINQLDRVQNGTTAYLEAQQLLVFARDKLNQLKPQ